MHQPSLASILYIVAAGLIPAIIQDANSATGESAILSHEAALLVGALRSGHQVQAMTTLPNGDVLFALSSSVSAP